MLLINNLVKKPILFEDATMYYNKWVSGIASRELATKKAKFRDIIGKSADYTDQSPNTAKADPVMPYPIPNAVDALGEIVTSASNALTLFRQALKNPTIKDDKEARAEIIKIINTLKIVNNELGDICNKLVDN